MLVQVATVLVPVYGWNETWYYAVMSQIIRYVYTMNAMFSINSVAHTWGYRPYDKYVFPFNLKFYDSCKKHCLIF